ncbi:hypothetical protein AOC36_07525 [Erysipelothrix larvae]|uniref:DUF6487 domain-containing protein n=1 Tax=Erysipelothrix larvae TaxID=1514105 RepID=A0A0X8H0X0_9FIRM|nr:PF20097 family protein [Erysipelothrix larvae]AMC93839.1 hypothetical protein AOC36_07525 [Erysipelothrix larvae]
MHKCPRCGSLLTLGYINNRSAILSWSDTNRCDTVSATWNLEKDQIRLARFDHDHGWSIPASCCEHCKMLFVEYDEKAYLSKKQ